MSKESNLNEGKDQTDEKVVLVSQESRVESHLPPPSLDPSSSSSSPFLPLISHDPSQVISASESASINLIAAQFAQVFTLVGRLSSENEALKAQVALHSSSIARLSSENEELRKRDEEKEKTMKEMTKAFGSHWVWEAGRGEGREGKDRWVWSGDVIQRRHLQISQSKPPRSLDSFPTELVHSIFSLLDRSDLLALCIVSFRILEIASRLVYGKKMLELESRMAAMFVGGRINNPLPSPNRVSSLLLLKCLTLSPSNFDATDFLPLPTGPPLEIDAVRVRTKAYLRFPLWFPILNLLDPISLTICGGPSSTVRVSPTPFHIAEDELYFLPRWTRLEEFQAAGSSSVCLPPDGTSTFAACIRRCHPGRSTALALVTRFSDGKKAQGEVLMEAEILSALARPRVPDLTRKHVVFYASVVKE